MARKKKQVRDELEELDEAYTNLTGRTPKANRGCGSIFSLLLILVLLCCILLAIYLYRQGTLPIL